MFMEMCPLPWFFHPILVINMFTFFMLLVEVLTGAFLCCIGYIFLFALFPLVTTVLVVNVYCDHLWRNFFLWFYFINCIFMNVFITLFSLNITTVITLLIDIDITVWFVDWCKDRGGSVIHPK